jgi:hypothetical protein
MVGGAEGGRDWVEEQNGEQLFTVGVVFSAATGFGALVSLPRRGVTRSTALCVVMEETLCTVTTATRASARPVFLESLAKSTFNICLRRRIQISVATCAIRLR